MRIFQTNFPFIEFETFFFLFYAAYSNGRIFRKLRYIISRKKEMRKKNYGPITGVKQSFNVLSRHVASVRFRLLLNVFLNSFVCCAMPCDLYLCRVHLCDGTMIIIIKIMILLAPLRKYVFFGIILFQQFQQALSTAVDGLSNNSFSQSL
jgi:hypothetical protein